MSDRHFLVLVLGASRFPLLRGKDNIAFHNSAQALKQFLAGRTDGPGTYEVADFFDAEDSPPDLVVRIHERLRSAEDATDLIIYYVGHGAFLSSREYFFALRSTRTQFEDVTGLRASSLAGVVRKTFRGSAVFVMLDCCFAGEAVREFQSADGLTPLVSRAFNHRDTALLVAASKDDAAKAPVGQPFTMFCEGLMSVLLDGIDGADRYLSLEEVGERLSEVLQDRYPSDDVVLPEVHSPRQRGMNVAKIPLFPNAAFQRPSSAVPAQRQPDPVGPAPAPMAAAPAEAPVAAAASAAAASAAAARATPPAVVPAPIVPAPAPAAHAPVESAPVAPVSVAPVPVVPVPVAPEPVAPEPVAPPPTTVPAVTPVSVEPPAPSRQAAPVAPSSLSAAVRRALTKAPGDAAVATIVRLIEDAERLHWVHSGRLQRPSDWQDRIDVWRREVAATRREPIVLIQIGPVSETELVAAVSELSGRLRARTGAEIPFDNNDPWREEPEGAL